MPRIASMHRYGQEDIEMMNIPCPVMPDAEEQRMLRTLAHEGAVLACRGAYHARFHEWQVNVSRDDHCGAGCTALVTVEIRCRHGELLERTCLLLNGCADGAAGR